MLQALLHILKLCVNFSLHLFHIWMIQSVLCPHLDFSPPLQSLKEEWSVDSLFEREEAAGRMRREEGKSHRGNHRAGCHCRKLQLSLPGNLWRTKQNALGRIVPWKEWKAGNVCVLTPVMRDAPRSIKSLSASKMSNCWLRRNLCFGEMTMREDLGCMHRDHLPWHSRGDMMQGSNNILVPP